MTQLTDRLNKQNIIELAKKKFEDSQKSTLPTVLVPLSSQGKIYPEAHPLRKGTIEMRYMTAYDEDILTNASYAREGVLFDKLLEAIITTPIDVEDISQFDRDVLIINARILAYGAEYPVYVTDPKTGKALERSVNLSQLKNKPFDLETDENGEIEYKIDASTTIKFTYLYDALEDMPVSEIMKQMICEVNGDRSDAIIDEFIRYKFMSFNAKPFRKYVKDNAPGLDLSYEFEGEDGSTFKSGFPLGADLFWF
jgi:hypothetical protein